MPIERIIIFFYITLKKIVQGLTNILWGRDICHTWNFGNCNVHFKEQTLNFANNNFKMLYFTKADNYTILKYDLGVTDFIYFLA